MTSNDFCFWLKGFLDLENKSIGVSAKQLEIIKRHLKMVYKYEIDPSFGRLEKEMKEIHNSEKFVITC